jgi:hypothetical protein
MVRGVNPWHFEGLFWICGADQADVPVWSGFGVYCGEKALPTVS